MPTDIDSIVDNCYLHLDKGHGFYVAAVDEKDQTVELQHSPKSLKNDQAPWVLAKRTTSVQLVDVLWMTVFDPLLSHASGNFRDC